MHMIIPKLMEHQSGFGLPQSRQVLLRVKISDFKALTLENELGLCWCVGELASFVSFLMASALAALDF